MRNEEDFLGRISVPLDAYYGIHTVRALQNFPASSEKMQPAFLFAYFKIKKACAALNQRLGYLDIDKAEAIMRACDDNWLADHVVVDALAGGAGTSVNMNINEVVANRAGEYMGYDKGSYVIHPVQDVNLHQSTNDTFVTAGKMAVIMLLQELVQQVIVCQEAVQQKERKYSNVRKIARTQLMDAVPILFGQTFGAWADALSRDRWRLYKVEERIRSVNIGGTAVGNGVGAPRDYILAIVDEVRKISGIKIAKADNLIDATQNMDVFVEVLGLLKALAVNLSKIANDIRLLGSGPNTAIGELILPQVQAGSSIMPGKINPVVPEYVQQLCFAVFAHDNMVSFAASSGNLELNQYSPLIVHYTLKSMYMLQQALISLATYIHGIEVNKDKCRKHLVQSTALLTPLIHRFGHEAVSAIIVDNDYDINKIITVISAKFNVTEEEIRLMLDIKCMTGLGFQ